MGAIFSQLFHNTFRKICVIVWLVLSSSVVFGGNVSTSVLHIDIILSAEKSSYVEIANSIKKNLPENHFSFRILFIDSFDEVDASKRPSDLIITVGMDAAKYVVRRQITAPIISVYIPQDAYQTLQLNNSVYLDKYLIGTVFIDQPLTRYLRLAQLLVPGVKKIGMILGPISSQSVANQRYTILNESLQISTLQIVGDDIELISLKKLMAENDVILTLPDPTVHHPFNAKRILFNAYREKIPVIAFSKAYVNAGALGSIHSSPSFIGLQTAEKIKDHFLMANSNRDKYEMSKYFDISINKNIAWTLGFAVPEITELRRSISLLEEKDN